MNTEDWIVTQDVYSVPDMKLLEAQLLRVDQITTYGTWPTLEDWGLYRSLRVRRMSSPGLGWTGLAWKMNMTKGFSGRVCRLDAGCISWPKHGNWEGTSTGRPS